VGVKLAAEDSQGGREFDRKNADRGVGETRLRQAYVAAGSRTSPDGIARARQSAAAAAVRLTTQFSSVAPLPDCELGTARSFFSGGVKAPYKILAGNAAQRYVKRQRKNNPLGQAHSPAILPKWKSTRLAGLFRPTIIGYSRELLLPRSKHATMILDGIRFIECGTKGKISCCCRGL
jgi:hypothetical protein